MGQELQCRVDFGGASARGKALLESSEVLFRGDFRLQIPFRSIRELAVSDGKLTIRFAECLAVFHLGDRAEKWAARIRNPPSRLDKLGVKQGTRVQLIGSRDDDFRGELNERGAIISRSKPELVFLRVEKREDLVRLDGLGNERVWVIYPKGVQAVRESDLRSAGLENGMVDVKVCAFSPTHTALKFTPRAREAKASGTRAKR